MQTVFNAKLIIKCLIVQISYRYIYIFKFFFFLFFQCFPRRRFSRPTRFEIYIFAPRDVNFYAPENERKYRSLIILFYRNVQVPLRVFKVWKIFTKNHFDDYNIIFPRSGTIPIRAVAYLLIFVVVVCYFTKSYINYLTDVVLFLRGFV